MNELITSSIGLYVDSKGQHFLQLISAPNENNYLIEITKQYAEYLSKNEYLAISKLPE